MQVYRCYFLADRRVASVEIIECEGDDEARRRGLELLADRNRGRQRFSGIELWELGRLVHVHPPTVEPTQPQP
jgi:hypothetical protein